MAGKKATRSMLQHRRAKNVHQDVDIVAQNERAWELLPLVFGAFFAAMLAIQMVMGW